ncbi:hypothetical protein [Peribacillus muralis]|uniref:hypothetical protein n=1 Tax=Peribacillus muralis TaxID=264697 RepID=UPI000B2DD73F|nr:hypothetical protein [Peribacillus muralis]
MIVQHSFKNLAASANNAPNVMSSAQYKEKLQLAGQPIYPQKTINEQGDWK